MLIWRLPFWFVTFRDPCPSSKPTLWDSCLSWRFSWINASFVLGTGTHEHLLRTAVLRLDLFNSAISERNFSKTVRICWCLPRKKRICRAMTSCWNLKRFRDILALWFEPNLCCKCHQVQRSRYWFKPVRHWRIKLKVERSINFGGSVNIGFLARTSCCNGIRSISVEPHEAQLWSGSRR